MHIGEWIVPHGLFEVDEVQAFNAVSLAIQQGAHLVQDGALGEDFVKIFRGNIFRIFASKLAVLTSSSIKRFILAFRANPENRVKSPPHCTAVV